jgi:hypothetical protein
VVLYTSPVSSSTLGDPGFQAELPLLAKADLIAGAQLIRSETVVIDIL